jgi:hypothetical protein
MTETADSEFELYRDPDVDGCHHFRDPAACDECAKEREHDQYIDHLVKMLDGTLRDAATALSAATGNLRELRSNEVYDIELADGGSGADMLAELEDAARHLRNAERIVKWRIGLFKEDEPSIEEERENAAQAAWAARTMSP